MAYTPELSQVGSATLRRLAWHLGRPMTKTLEIVLQQTASDMKNGQVCTNCRDKTFCDYCPFKNQ